MAHTILCPTHDESHVWVEVSEAHAAVALHLYMAACVEAMRARLHCQERALWRDLPRLLRCCLWAAC
jgi:hypothetical protein